ncbi:hypothetical protein AJ88_17180 [Mesorhizobium amorphae CCBAU 01583]|nr:hypothetical protein AJ88_17180 [Mesorhizobium amorphae CCBAU 01583]
MARGFGHIRLKDGKIWTLLTTMVELKGHEEPAGFARPMGAKHGHGKNRPTWKEEREKEAAELGFKTQPHTLIIGGGQGGIALGARLRQLGVPTIIVEKNERAGDSWRKRYKSSACTTRSGTTICPISIFPGTGRSSRPRTRSATGWKCTPRSWS